MEKEQRDLLIRILVAGGLFLAALLLPVRGWLRPAAFLLPYGVVGWDVLYKAARNLVRGKLLDEHFLMAVATLGALALGEYPESVFVMLFYQIGEFFQDQAVDRSRRDVRELLETRDENVRVEGPEGLREADPRTVAVGEVLRVRPGERILLDGVILEGETTLDTAALTGESLPRYAGAGVPVAAGCVNCTGLIRLRVTRPYEESAVARILELVEHAAERKAGRERFITRFARVYTPAVVAAAALLALLPPLVAGQPWASWVHRALSFLVVSCPCALVISVPLAFFGGIGAAARRGILVKGGGELEKLATLHTLALDKTGTLTRGQPEVTAIDPQDIGEGELLRLAALAETASRHPIAQALRCAAGLTGEERAESARELPGQGLIARAEGREVAVGNEKLMRSLGLEVSSLPETGTAVFVAVDGVFAGTLQLEDRVKPEAGTALAALRALGLRRLVLLTGDGRAAGEAVARELALDGAETELLPEDKVSRVETLLADVPRGGSLAFVGDGINDAPVLTRADLGIAMGALGSDAAIEAADVVLMDDRLDRLPEAVVIARRTLTIVRQNIALALGVKALVLLLGALGRTSLWMAAFADGGVALLATLNALRALHSLPLKACSRRLFLV